MKIPLTKYGLPQVVIYPVVVLALMFAIPQISQIFNDRFHGFISVNHFESVSSVLIILIEVLLTAVLIWSLMFFRDPERRSPSDRNLLLAPADGQVTDIETVDPVRDPTLDFLLVRDREDKGSNGVNDPPAFLRASASYDASRGSRRRQEGGCGAALRIGVFLSIFDTHINRAPCNVKVEKITYRKGKYKNAMNPQSGRVNESNDLHLVRTDSPQDRLIVRQISGAIARRIVCDKVEGRELTGGQKFGMIKFGSRTELYVPLREAATPGSERYPPTTGVKCLVQIGDKVKAGLTPLVKYEILNNGKHETQNSKYETNPKF